MMHLADMTGLAGSATAISAATVWFYSFLMRGKMPVIVAVVALTAALVPIGGLPLAAYTRGMTGDFSITTFFLLVLFIVRRLPGGRTAGSKEKFTLLAFVALAATALYPMALGAGSFDPYRLGYGSTWFVGGLFAVALTAFFWRFFLLALVIALAVLAWATGWHESANLWDYLLDPFVAIYALGTFLKHGARRVRHK